ncbi:hypothetical protein CJ030_MR3G006209 [Morella rubra]|uniref:Uncharacterized protein n=1 Tax=Morella rubra TaxID=262757 RepID=A0A6A1W3Y4_9ROSI|nr:hypothetical protein CJ030_MR3G006209 [Morella rubra]
MKMQMNLSASRRTYQELYEESIKVKKENCVTLKKINLVEKERDELAEKSLEKNNMVQELIEMNSSLKDCVLKLTKKLNQANVQLKNFSSGTSKVGKMFSIGHSDGNKRGLGFKNNASVSTSSKKVMFIPATQNNPTIPAALNKVNLVVAFKPPVSIKSKFSKFNTYLSLL